MPGASRARSRRAAAGLSVQTSDDVADRCRKLAFGIGPLLCAPDVLVADDADDVATLKNRCVEHRRDAEWCQVRRTEFLRHRIAITVDESNDARALQHAEVDRKIVGVQDGALVDVASIGLMEIVAAYRAGLIVEEPDTDTLHLQRGCGDLGDDSENIAKRSRVGHSLSCEAERDRLVGLPGIEFNRDGLGAIAHGATPAIGNVEPAVNTSSTRE